MLERTERETASGAARCRVCCLKRDGLGVNDRDHPRISSSGDVHKEPPAMQFGIPLRLLETARAREGDLAHHLVGWVRRKQSAKRGILCRISDHHQMILRIKCQFVSTALRARGNRRDGSQIEGWLGIGSVENL